MACTRTSERSSSKPMDTDVTSSDLLADVRHRAPALAGSEIDYGILTELTGFSVKLTWILAGGLIAREIGDAGITPLRFSMLEVIARNPGLQQMQLATALTLTRPATTLELDFWEDRGCIERRKLVEDRRSFGVYATALGMRQLKRLRADFRRADAALTSQLTEAEALQLRQLLRKIHL
jgi:DNA-binding MarR family transcriptional regulator